MHLIPFYVLLISTLLLASVSYSSTAWAQTNETKVVVIPMAGDEAHCTWRWSPQVTLSGQSGQVTAFCNADERIISGGYFTGSFNTTKDCRVVSQIAVFSENSSQFPADGWRTIWYGSSSTQCDGFRISGQAFCCKR